MAFSVYQASVPQALRTLEALTKIIDKAQAHCTAKKIDPAVLVGFRLSPDMLPFSRQIQIACDAVTRGAARLTASEIPSNPDTETTFDELKARIAKTVAYLKTFTPAQFDGSEDRKIEFKAGENEMKFVGGVFLSQSVQPNFYFHVTMAYAILRHCGVEIGKRDFLGPQ